MGIELILILLKELYVMICFMLYNIIYNDTLYDIYVMIKIGGMKLNFIILIFKKNLWKVKYWWLFFFFFVFSCFGFSVLFLIFFLIFCFCVFFEDFLLVCFKMYGFSIEDLILFKFEKLGLFGVLCFWLFLNFGINFIIMIL